MFIHVHNLNYSKKMNGVKSFMQMNEKYIYSSHFSPVHYIYLYAINNERVAVVDERVDNFINIITEMDQPATVQWSCQRSLSRITLHQHKMTENRKAKVVGEECG